MLEEELHLKERRLSDSDKEQTVGGRGLVVFEREQAVGRKELAITEREQTLGRLRLEVERREGAVIVSKVWSTDSRAMVGKAEGDSRRNEAPCRLVQSIISEFVSQEGSVWQCGREWCTPIFPVVVLSVSVDEQTIIPCVLNNTEFAFKISWLS
jgi:hypothetical protein